MEKPIKIKIYNLQYFDPKGNPASAYVVRTWFSINDNEEEFADGLYCSQNKEEAFQQMIVDWNKHCPNKKITKYELLYIEESWPKTSPANSH